MSLDVSLTPWSRPMNNHDGPLYRKGHFATQNITEILAWHSQACHYNLLRIACNILQQMTRSIAIGGHAS